MHSNKKKTHALTLHLSNLEDSNNRYTTINLRVQTDTQIP